MNGAVGNQQKYMEGGKGGELGCEGICWCVRVTEYTMHTIVSSCIICK